MKKRGDRAGLAKKQVFTFKGETKDDSLVIGSHGNAVISVDGIFDLSGIVYCPKYTVTLIIEGTGTVAFRGICNKIIIKKLSGNATLNLRDLTCKELRCEAVRDQGKIIAGKVRIVTKANLFDEAVLQLQDKPLITSAITSDNSKIVYGTDDLVFSF
jgi:hypothetical protein